MALANSKLAWFRVMSRSLQSNHLHLLVEADSSDCLARGMAGLSIRMARAVNRLLGRCGRLLGERYHCHALRSPREVRNALRYVLMNRVKHCPEASWLDLMSSAYAFDGWRAKLPMPPSGYRAPPVQAPLTWLARTGWRRHGPISIGRRSAG